MPQALRMASSIRIALTVGVSGTGGGGSGALAVGAGAAVGAGGGAGGGFCSAAQPMKAAVTTPRAARVALVRPRVFTSFIPSPFSGVGRSRRWVGRGAYLGASNNHGSPGCIPRVRAAQISNGWVTRRSGRRRTLPTHRKRTAHDGGYYRSCPISRFLKRVVR